MSLASRPLTVATGDYLHTASLRAPAAGADGLDLQHVAAPPGAIFRRMLDEAAYDVAEMSLATIYMLADRGDRRFVPLPVFLSRVFRHSAVYVSAPEIRRPEDLPGRDVGVLRYGMTMAVWVRAVLADDHGVPPGALGWWTGEAEPILPPGLPIRGALAGAEALERAAAEGRLHCLVSAQVPRAFPEGRLRRLFPDFEARERAWHARTGIFPIMHAVVIKRRLVEEHPGLAAALLARFEAAKRRAEEAVLETAVSACPVPWLAPFAEATRAAMGGALWPYGVQGNAATLAAFGQAIAAQGLTRRALAPGDVFADPA